MRAIIMTLLIIFSYQSFGNVQQFKLDNGLKILVEEDHRAPVAISIIWYNIGSADEPGGITGISHALEHLMFKGTKKYPLGVFSKTFANLGGQINAFTTNDYTAYYEKIAATNLDTSFKLEADRMQNLIIDKNEFAKEIKVIEEERRLRTNDNPQALTFERFLATAHLSAPYHHPVIGWMSDIKQLTVEDARRWHKKYYAPNNATLVVVGDVTASKVYQLAEKYFGKIPKQQIEERKSQIEPPLLGKKSVEIHAPAEVPLLMLGFNCPTLKTRTAKNILDPYALELIAGILAAGDSGRVNIQLVHGKKVASSIDVYYNLYARFQTEFVIYGAPSQSHKPEELKEGILAQIKKLQKELVSDTELKRVKTQIIAQKTFEKDSVFGKALEIGLLETVGLGWQIRDIYVEKINDISAQEIQHVAKLYFNENNMTEALLIPLSNKE